MAGARLYWHIFVTEKTPAIVAEQLRFVERQPFPVTAVITRSDNYALMDDIILKMLSPQRVKETV